MKAPRARSEAGSRSHWRTDPQSIAHAVVASAGAYALVVVLLELLVSTSYVANDSPLELATDLLCLGGLSLTIVQLRAHWHDARARGKWLLAVAAIALLAVSEAGEWTSLAGRFWDEDYRYKLPLWVGGAVALYLCTSLDGVQIWVRRSVVWGFVFQSVSNLLDIGDGRSFLLSFVPGDAWEFATDFAEFISLECYVAALAFTFLPPLRIPGASTAAGRAGGPHLVFGGIGVTAPRATVPSKVGAQARVLYHDLHLFRAARYPAARQSGWKWSDNQDETRLPGLRGREGVARPESQARQRRAPLGDHTVW